MEEAAQFAVDHGLSAFGRMTADYDWWLRVFNGGFSGLVAVRSDAVDVTTGEVSGE